MTGKPHDARPCHLGEGALWHPLRQQLFWCDINTMRILCEDGREWQFDEHVSALGWIDHDAFLVATETALIKFNIETGAKSTLCPLEADDPSTRSNDGRADPWGGFWIGTMRKENPDGGGAIYRYYQGELRRLFAPLSIPNAICFAPDKSCAYWADTVPSKVFRSTLDKDGWPNAAPTVFLDLAPEGLNPDGAIITADGSFLNAQWGAARVAKYSSVGTLLESFALPTSHVTCPALGGPDMSTLFATTAQEHMDAAQLEAEPLAGQTFAIETKLRGQTEHQVIL